MKKMIVVLFVCLLLLCLYTGCNAKTQQEEQSTEPQLQTQQEEQSAEPQLQTQQEEQSAEPQLQTLLSEEGRAFEQLAQQKSYVQGVWEGLRAIAQHEKTIDDVRERYDETIRLTNIEYGKHTQQQVESYMLAEPKDPWENEEDFQTRVAEYEASLAEEDMRQIALIEAQRDREIAQLTSQMNTYKAEFSRQEYQIGFSMTEVKVSPFDIDNKYFPIEITSKDNLLSFKATIQYKITTLDREEISREYARVENAAKENAVMASIDYSITEKYPRIWEISVRKINLHSLSGDDNTTHGLLNTFDSSVLVQADQHRFVKIHDGTISPLYAVVPIVVLPKEASILVEGQVVGTGEVFYGVDSSATKSLTISAQSEADYFTQKIIVLISGQNPLIEIASVTVGGIGPGGGYVFYDKGSHSNGWRFLEAAPTGWSGTSEDPKYIFGEYRLNGSNVEVGTSTSIGSGKANTEALVRAMGNEACYDPWDDNKKVVYAAKIASDYRSTVDGVIYDDWFLPSKDELYEIYKSPYRNNHWGFSDSYWSSSEAGRYNALFLYSGSWIHNLSRNRYNRVRPVRAF